MDLNEFYTFSVKNYRVIPYIEKYISLLDSLENHSNNDLTIRIYDNKKLLYQFSVYNTKIVNIKKGNGDYVKFKLVNIKKELIKNSLKLLDSDDRLNHILFLEILKLKLNENT